MTKTLKHAEIFQVDGHQILFQVDKDDAGQWCVIASVLFPNYRVERKTILPGSGDFGMNDAIQYVNTLEQKDATNIFGQLVDEYNRVNARLN